MPYKVSITDVTISPNPVSALQGLVISATVTREETAASTWGEWNSYTWTDIAAYTWSQAGGN